MSDVTYTDFDGADIIRSCTRKKPYPSQEVAKLAVASIMESSAEANVRAYACRHCGTWHVGRVPSSERVPRAVEAEQDEWARRPRGNGRMRRRAYGETTSVRRRSPRQIRMQDDD